MDGRYGLQHGWDNNSALEAYGAVHEPNYRGYDDRRFLDERYPRDSAFSRGAFQRDVERDNYAAPPPVGLWPQARRRGYEEEYPLEREPRRNDKPYVDPYHEVEHFRDGHRAGRFGMRERDDYAFDDHDYRHRRDDSRERDYDYGRHSHDSDYDRSRRDESWRRRGSRDRERDRRDLSHERDLSPYKRESRSRSRSRGHDDRSKSRSPHGRSRGRSRGRSHHDDSYDDRYDRMERRRDRDEKRQEMPSATVVVKGLSQKTTEEDLYQILAEWGPLRHVRVIKERNSGISRGFAFIDFPSVDAAQAMMDKVGLEGLVLDGRKLLFEYSKPTGSSGGAPYGQDGLRSSHASHRSTIPSDWMCTICGCVNFARRVSCFQCNESRTDDAPPADMSSSTPAQLGRKGAEAGPTHVLVVRGLDENADEEMLRYEFSKHAPIKDLRLVRDKFTHVSRGFAFVHFYSVEDATKALEATNGTNLERNGQILRVAYAKSILGPGLGSSAHSQSSTLAAAAIEAATFAQQYDAVGWAPKEYNPDDRQPVGIQEQGTEVAGRKEGSAPQAGFVWDEASGYYYDASSGFYYDSNTGLYYDGNGGIWYSYDHQTQQYVPCVDQNANKTSENESEAPKAENTTTRKVVISAPAATVKLSEKPASLPDAVQAAASAALAAEKKEKEKEKSKEIKLASKSSIVANKKKMNHVLSMWKQRSHEGQTPRVALDDSQSNLAVDRQNSISMSLKTKAVGLKENVNASSGFLSDTSVAQATVSESDVKPCPVSNSSGGTLMGVIRSGKGVIKSDTVYPGMTGLSTPSSSSSGSVAVAATNSDTQIGSTSFRTDISALGNYTPPAASASGRRKFSETPLQSTSAQRELHQTAYRDRAAERRRMYGSSASCADDDLELGDPDQDVGFRKGASDISSMPFPPGVGGRGTADNNVQNYDVIPSDKAIDESNVGNRMLRNMGWTEGLGLGKDGSGMVAPVQAQSFDNRAGLGSQQKKVDPGLEVHPGDSYKTLIQKKALQRFREMS
ncbi:SUPPRESSOR OF ABI3-5-like isoform X2 [Chenopodium quinoa]|uniref:SUPPRESSOR OF ABI3-5-like isoform X2 n=1 Tax=Chenopodium quinoa TaxID=63459 RepID=UPI000B77A98F|nr:SUPPRESSOR OF ABI3-5-like isoform X2 [Chenopodium quinoa]